MVSTNVGEEGLDIAECDLVIFYDVVASEIRLIQRKGRTARHRRGRVIILYCKETHEEVYLRIALSKLRKMNVNLKNPQQLKASNEVLSSFEEFQGPEINESNGSYSEPPRSIKNIEKSKHQSNLHTYIKKKKSPSVKTELERQEKDSLVKISKALPMKFGIRKKLQKDNIDFSISSSDLHMVIFNKVLIQVYNPQQLSDLKKFTLEFQDFGEFYELFIIVFDFVDFIEEYSGEKRYLKKKISELKNTLSYQIIPIEIEEELYFIVKSIVESIVVEGS